MGIAEAGVYDAVRLTIQGRSCTMDVMEVADDVPVRIGQLPLEHLDFVIDPQPDPGRKTRARRGTHVRALLTDRASLGTARNSLCFAGTRASMTCQVGSKMLPWTYESTRQDI